jgi:hypothetical protein
MNHKQKVIKKIETLLIQNNNLKPTIMSLVRITIFIILSAALVMGLHKDLCVNKTSSENIKGQRKGKGNGKQVLGLIAGVTFLIILSKRRPLTAGEIIRMNYDPVFSYKYMSGKN